MFSPALEQALTISLEAHNGQLRKGGETPYVVHPLHVGFLLARYGAEEDVILAGLLHDVVEDSEEWTLERLEDCFGTRVRAIVAELTEDKSRSWRERKQTAVQHAPGMSPEAALVKACDKLHNLSCLAAQLEQAAVAEEVWKSFRGGRAETLEMDRQLVEALAPRVDPSLAAALRAAQAAVEAQAG